MLKQIFVYDAADMMGEQILVLESESEAKNVENFTMYFAAQPVPEYQILPWSKEAEDRYSRDGIDDWQLTDKQRGMLPK